MYIKTDLLWTVANAHVLSNCAFCLCPGSFQRVTFCWMETLQKRRTIAAAVHFRKSSIEFVSPFRYSLPFKVDYLKCSNFQNGMHFANSTLCPHRMSLYWVFLEALRLIKESPLVERQHSMSEDPAEAAQSLLDDEADDNEDATTRTKDDDNIARTLIWWLTQNRRHCRVFLLTQLPNKNTVSKF